MPRLALGPILRAFHCDQATVWVETDVPCEVAVGPHVAHTVTLLGHHYAFIDVDGLAAARPYTVALDGEQVWPSADGLPPSVLRALPQDRLKVVFGSCRTILPADQNDPDRVDALREYAWRAAQGRPDELPDVLVFLGDQVYADEGAPATRRFIRRRRRSDGPTGAQAHRFAEFVELYRESWRDPAVRWLLSTVPSLMIFDDHEIIDNWNTSGQWLAEHRSQPWWRKRVQNGLAAYWMYQHLGNLSAEERESDPAFAALRDGDQSVALDAFDTRALHGDLGTSVVRWSYARELGPARLVMVDSRDGRVLSGGRREMLDPDELTWLEQQVREPAPYLLMGTSLPLLLPRGVHGLESAVSAACARRWGNVVAKVGEEARQAAQLTHWATFPTSFRRVVEMARTAGTPGRQGVFVLSGDVHFSYAARVNAWGDGTTPRVPTHQLVSSPLCHDLGRSIAGGLRAIASRRLDRIAGRLATIGSEPRPQLDWSMETGPWFHNVISTLDLRHDGATVLFERTHADGPVGSRLTPVAEHRLT